MQKEGSNPRDDWVSLRRRRLGTDTHRGTAHETRAQAEDGRGAGNRGAHGEPPGPVGPGSYHQGPMEAGGAAGAHGSPMEAGEPPGARGSRQSHDGSQGAAGPQAQALPHGAEGAEPVDTLTSNSSSRVRDRSCLFFTPRGLWQLSGQPSVTSTEGLPGDVRDEILKR